MYIIFTANFCENLNLCFFLPMPLTVTFDTTGLRKTINKNTCKIGAKASYDKYTLFIYKLSGYNRNKYKIKI